MGRRRNRKKTTFSNRQNHPIFRPPLTIIILVYAWVLNRQHWLTLPSFLFFGVGWYLHNVVQAAVIVSIPGKNPARALVMTLLGGLILFLLFRQIRRGSLQRES